MRVRVIFTPEAEQQLKNLYEYIAAAASPTTAQRFTARIVERCLDLETMPRQGTPREDLRPGLRTLAFKRRVVIVYSVGESDVTVVGIFYGGQDFESLLREND